MLYILTKQSDELILECKVLFCIFVKKVQITTCIYTHNNVQAAIEEQ